MYYPAGSVRLRGGTLWVAPPQRHQTGLPGASGWYCEGYSGLGLRGLMGDPGGGKRWAVKSGGHNRDIKRPQPGAAGAETWGRCNQNGSASGDARLLAVGNRNRVIGAVMARRNWARAAAWALVARMAVDSSPAAMARPAIKSSR